MRNRTFFLIFALLCLLTLGSGVPTVSQPTLLLEVNTLIDETDGSCDDDCSLRDAIKLVPTGASVKIPISGTIQLTLGELVIDKPLNILGPGYDRFVISGEGVSRVFNIQPGKTVTISGLTIANGSADNGAGIYNAGYLDLKECTLYHNIATLEGGGVYNYTYSRMNVKQSSFIDNQAQYGGGVKNVSATVELWNSTFSGNVAVYRGGGVDNDRISPHPVSTVEIKNSTFSGNTNGGVVNQESNTTAMNTLIAGNINYDCSGTFDVSSFNMSADDTCTPGFTTSSPSFLKMLWQGWVYILEAGSTAIDRGTNTGCISTDQLGNDRPEDGNGDGEAVCDVGAYELQGLAPVKVRLFLPMVVRH